MKQENVTSVNENAQGALGANAELIAALQKESLKNSNWHKLKKHRRIIWFLIPAALFTLIFSYLPMLGILFSFKGPEFDLTRGDVMWNLTHGSWTFQNYLDIFVDASFFKAVGNTLIINVARLLICFPLSILLAVMLSELKAQGMSKTILIILCIPNFLSWAIVIGIWEGLLNPDGGVLDKILVFLQLNEANNFIMAEEGLFKGLAVFFSAWKGTGWGCILYYAAIAGIDKSYYESATLEGANKLQKMWYLTIPSIMPTIALTLVMNISGMMAAGFEQTYTMMSVNTDFYDSQMTLDTYLYDISVVNRTNVPFATALGVFNGFIALALMLIGNAITVKTLKRGLW